VPVASWRATCQQDGCQIRTRTPGPLRVRHTNSACPSITSGGCSCCIPLYTDFVTSWILAVCFSGKLQDNKRIIYPFSVILRPSSLLISSTGIAYRFSEQSICSHCLGLECCANPECMSVAHYLGTESASQALSILGAWVRNLLHKIGSYSVPRHRTCWANSKYTRCLGTEPVGPTPSIIGA
jgi:hypothetical protein